jgi:peptide/nickel transport system substrate-binding protein
MIVVLSACAAPAAQAPAAPAAPQATEAPAPTEAATEEAKPTEAPAAEAPTDMSKTVVVATAEDSASLDPGRAFEFTPGLIHKATYQTLVTWPDDSVSDIKPQLAEKWEISSDGTVYTFTLNSNAKFSDGTPVTGKDVMFSINRLKNIKGNPSSLVAAASIKSVEAPDDKTVVLTLENPNPAVLSILTGSFFSVVNSEAVKKQGGTDAEDADKTDKAEQWLNQHSEGSGPFMLEKWEPKVEAVLVRNPNYWGTPPAMERVIIRNVPEAATQKLQLEAGDVDIALDLSADQVPSLEGNDKVKVFQGTANNIYFLIMNQDKDIGGPMSDPKVNQAVRLALDYEGIKALAGGAAGTPASVVPLGFIGAYGEDKALKRDVDAAKKLLAEAGFENGFEADLHYPDLTIGGINFATMAQKVQADLAEAGITVNLKGEELQTSLAAYRDGKQNFGLWLWGPDFLDPGNYLEFLPEMKVGLRGNWSNANSDATIQELRDKAAVATAPEERVKLFQQIQDYLQQNGPFAPFVQGGTQIGYNSGLNGFVYNPAWRIDFALLSK